MSIRAGRHVAHLRRAAAGWALRHLPAEAARPGLVTDSGGEVERFDAVLLAMPHAQAGTLLRAAGQAGLAASLDPVVVAPCWTLMLAFAQPVPGADVYRREGDLVWAAREGSRPGGPGGPDRWVAHASPDFSRARLERAADEVAPEMLARFAALAGTGAAPLHVAAHRWRYALTERPLGRPALWEAGAAIGVCGDWCLGGRVEAAWESGRALAGMVSLG